MSTRSTIANFSIGDVEDQDEIIQEADDNVQTLSVVNISSIDVQDVVDASDVHESTGGANPLEIPGNDYWAEYWAHHSEAYIAEPKLPGLPTPKGITPKGPTGTRQKRKLSRTKRVRKCFGLILMVVIIASVAISMIVFYSSK